MVTNNYSSAIIGLDAQFANQGGFQQDIDRVERALYLGKEQGKDQGNAQANEQANQAPAKISLSDCQQAVARMALANQVNSSDVKVVLVTQDDADKANLEMASFEAVADNVLVVNSLAKALVQIDLLITQNNLVALVGVHLAEQQAPDKELPAPVTISFDQNFSGYQSCYGVAALLIFIYQLCSN